MTKHNITLELDEETIRCLSVLGQPVDVLTSLAHSSVDSMRRTAPPRDAADQGTPPPSGGANAAVDGTGRPAGGPVKAPCLERRRYRDRSVARERESATFERESATMILDQREANAAMVKLTLRTQELMAQAEAAQERAEAATAKLGESDQRYRALFEVSPVAVYSCDAQGVIQEFNRHAAELWGRSPAAGDADERFCGSFKLFRPDGSFLPREQCPMADVVNAKAVIARDTELIIERPDGSRVNVVVNSQPLTNSDGERAGAISCFYDITVRKQAEIALADSLARAGELAELRELFIGILGHDLRNPLASISMGAHLLLRRDRLDEQDGATVKRMLSACKRMTGMIKQVLDVTRARLAGGLLIEPRPTDLHEICRNIVDEFASAIRLEVDGDLTGSWDEERIAEALSNLVGNAIEHATPGTAVLVRASAEAAHVLITIENQGEAIPMDVLPHIFEPFRRGQQDEKSKSGNLGLGLFIAHQIVLAHGGTLGAHSAEGKTTFSMRLPREVMAVARPPATAARATRPRGGLSIALVDDSDELRATFRKVLERRGHEVMEARDGIDGLALITAEQPNVAIVDIGLPGMSGYELARQIRALLGNSVRLLAMTGHASESDRLEALSAGFDTQMSKPVDIDRLEEVLDSIPRGVDADLAGRTHPPPQ